MSIQTPDRIVELWPSLSPEARERLVRIAEGSANANSPLNLSEHDEQLLAQAREDFRLGRTISLDEYKAELDGYFTGRRIESKIE